MSDAARFADGFEPRFDIDAAYGRQGELFIGSVISALRDGSAEVKTDAQSLRTGNLYVEMRCWRRGQWRKSGLATTTAETWSFVLGTTGLALVVAVDLLKSIAGDLWRAGRVAEERDGSHPTKGVLVPIARLINDARRRGAA